MKNLFFGLIATVLFSISASAANANMQIADKQNSAIVVNNNDKLKASFDLGNVTNLSDSQIDTLCENLTNDIKNIKDVDECTISMTATVDIGVGSVSVTVSYTAANCELATAKAIAGLKAAVKKVLSMM